MFKFKKKLTNIDNTLVKKSKKENIRKKRNVDDILNEKKIYKRNFKVVNKKRFYTIFTLSIVFIVLLSYYIFTIILGNTIVKNTNNKISYLNSNLGYIYINKNNIEKIKNDLDFMTFKNNSYEITFIANSLSRKTITNINFKKDVLNTNEFKNLNAITIDLKDIVNYNKIHSVSIKNISSYFNSKVVDIYKLDNNNYTLYLGKVNIENSNVTFTPDEKCKYIIIYVPIQTINLNLQDSLNLGLNISYDLNINVEPKNSTVSTLQYKIDNEDIISISDNAIISTKSEGTTNLNITSADGNFSKTLEITVSKDGKSISTNVDNISLNVGKSKEITATLFPETEQMIGFTFKSTDENIAKVDETGKVEGINAGKCNIIIETTDTPKISKSIPVEITKVTTNVPTNNVSSPTYINGILIVNKTIALPSNYNPGVNQEALAKFNEMKADAKKEGHNLKIVSGFRSYSTQQKIYNNNVALYGKKSTDTFSAMPGHSEHQSGLAFDISSLEQSYGNTPEGIWLANNCHKYGFIIRYQKNKESITGYMYEPWHIRYIGVQHATKMFNSHQCLEEYLGLV